MMRKTKRCDSRNFIAKALAIALFALTTLLLSVLPLQAQGIVDSRSGQLILTATDLVLQAGPINLEIRRSLGPGRIKPSLLGNRWMLNWESRVNRDGPSVLLEEGAGIVKFDSDESSSRYRTASEDRVVFEKDGRAIRSKPDGIREVFDAQGRLVERDYRNGNKVALQYDSEGPLARIEGPFGSFFRFIADKEGRVILVESSTGETVRYTYAQGELAEVRVGSHAPTRYSYDTGGRLVSIEEPQTGPLQFTYDSRGRVLSRRWADGSNERYEYDEASNWFRHTNPAGGVTSIRWSEDGLREERVDPLGNKTSVKYNPQYRPLSVTGPTGIITRFTYDSLGRLTAIQDPSGEPVQFEFLEKSELLKKIVFRDGMVRHFAYDKNGNLTSIKEGQETLAAIGYLPSGLIASVKGSGSPEKKFSYYPSGYLKSETNVLGEATHYEYDQRFNLIREVSPNGEVKTYRYDDSNRLITMTESSGTTSYEHDASGHLIRITSPGGEVTRFAYDVRGRIETMEDPASGAMRYAYHPLGFVQVITDAAGNSTRFEYDKAGNLIRGTNALGGVTEWGYDALGRITRHVISAAETIRYEYDTFDRLAMMVLPDGKSETYTYDKSGNLIKLEQPSGAVWNYGYDQAGRLTKISGPLGYTQSIRYDGEGRVVEVVDALGRKSTYAYDSLGRITGLTDATGETMRFLHALQGQQVTVLDPLRRNLELKYGQTGRITEIRRAGESLAKFDFQKGRLSKLYGPAEGWTSISYDMAGRRNGYQYSNREAFLLKYNTLGQIVEAADAIGRTWGMSYTAVGDLASLTAPDGATYSYAYTAFRQLKSITDAKGHTRRFEHDAFGRRIRETDPLGRTTEMGYQFFRQPERVKLPSGQTIETEYDLLGRVVQIRYSDQPPARFWYDLAGNLIKEQQGESWAEYRYDALDRVIQATYHPSNQTVRYAYDKGGRRTGMSVEGMGGWAYAYDLKDRLIELKDHQGKLTRFEYDGAGRVKKKILPGGVTVERSYDTRGRVLSFAARSPSKGTFLDRQFNYDSSGNLVGEIRENGIQLIYRYDRKGQLIEVTGPWGSERIDFDEVGNVLLPGQPADYDAADQLVRFGEETFGYDMTGRLIRRERGTGKVEYVFGHMGQLVAVKRDGTAVAEYGYDPRGRRIWKKINGRMTHYVYDGLNLILELDESKKISRVWTPSSELDQPVGFADKNRACYPIADIFNSVVVLTDDGGETIALFDYKPFGDIRSASAGQVLGETSPFGFTGGQFDPETGLYYFRARYYDPRLHRFLTPDPIPGSIANPASLHLYQYAYNNPLRYRDPNGTTGEEVANGLTDLAGSFGHSLGYGLGYGIGYMITLPTRAILRGVGDKNKTELLNQGLDSFARHGTGVLGDTAAATVTAIVTEPLRVGSGFGTASVDYQQGNYGTAALHAVSDVARAVPFARTAKNAPALAEILKGTNNATELLSAQTNADKILSSGRIWGQTEGSVYAGIHQRTSGLGAYLYNGRPPRAGDVEFVFRDQAASLFGQHEVTGIFSLWKRLGGQYKGGFGDIKIIEYTIDEAGRIIITKAEQLAGEFAGQSFLKAGAKLWTRRILDPVATTGIAGGYGYLGADALSQRGQQAGDRSGLDTLVSTLSPSRSSDRAREAEKALERAQRAAAQRLKESAAEAASLVQEAQAMERGQDDAIAETRDWYQKTEQKLEEMNGLQTIADNPELCRQCRSRVEALNSLQAEAESYKEPVTGNRDIARQRADLVCPPISAGTEADVDMARNAAGLAKGQASGIKRVADKANSILSEIAECGARIQANNDAIANTESTLKRIEGIKAAAASNRVKVEEGSARVKSFVGKCQGLQARISRIQGIAQASPGSVLVSVGADGAHEIIDMGPAKQQIADAANQINDICSRISSRERHGETYVGYHEGVQQSIQAKAQTLEPGIRQAKPCAVPSPPAGLVENLNALAGAAEVLAANAEADAMRAVQCLAKTTERIPPSPKLKQDTRAAAGRPRESGKLPGKMEGFDPRTDPGMGGGAPDFAGAEKEAEQVYGGIPQAGSGRGGAGKGGGLGGGAAVAQPSAEPPAPSEPSAGEGLYMPPVAGVPGQTGLADDPLRDQPTAGEMLPRTPSARGRPQKGGPYGATPPAGGAATAPVPPVPKTPPGGTGQPSAACGRFQQELQPLGTRQQQLANALLQKSQELGLVPRESRYEPVRQRLQSELTVLQKQYLENTDRIFAALRAARNAGCVGREFDWAESLWRQAQQGRGPGSTAPPAGK